MIAQTARLSTLVMLLCIPPAAAQIDYNRGGKVVLAAPLSGSVRVDWNTPSMHTELNLLDGGSISGSLTVHHIGLACIFGGSVGTYLEINNQGRVEMSGGGIGWDVAVFDNGQFVLSGGTIGTEIRASHDAIITIYGSGFRLDGTPVSGEIGSVYGNQWWLEQNRRLTGTLADGRQLDNIILLNNSAKIILIPEPAALTLLAFGTAVLRKRRPRHAPDAPGNARPGA